MHGSLKDTRPPSRTHDITPPLFISTLPPPRTTARLTIGSTAGSNYFVRILSTLDREVLKPNTSVALHRHSHSVVEILPPESDSTIQLMQERPDVTYHDIGGMDMQKQEVNPAWSWWLSVLSVCVCVFLFFVQKPSFCVLVGAGPDDVPSFCITHRSRGTNRRFYRSCSCPEYSQKLSGAASCAKNLQSSSDAGAFCHESTAVCPLSRAFAPGLLSGYSLSVARPRLGEGSGRAPADALRAVQADRHRPSQRRPHVRPSGNGEDHDGQGRG